MNSRLLLPFVLLLTVNITILAQELPEGIGNDPRPGPVQLRAGAPKLDKAFRAVAAHCFVLQTDLSLQCEAVFENRSGKGIRSYGIVWHYVDGNGRHLSSSYSTADSWYPNPEDGSRNLIKAGKTTRAEWNFGKPLFPPAAAHAHLRFVELEDGSVMPPEEADGDMYKRVLANREKPKPAEGGWVK